MKLAIELTKVKDLADFDWPPDVPFPQEGPRFTNVIEKATYDLVCMVGSYIFLHEIRHAQLWGASEEIQDEELECDRYALDMMIGKISEYAAGSGYPARDVLGKRLVGILFAKLAILTITPEHKWSDSTDHPSVKDRIRRVLEAAVNPLPDWFWPTSAALLAAFARHYGLIGRPISFGSSRELAFVGRHILLSACWQRQTIMGRAELRQVHKKAQARGARHIKGNRRKCDGRQEKDESRWQQTGVTLTRFDIDAGGFAAGAGCVMLSRTDRSPTNSGALVACRPRLCKHLRRPI